MTTRRTDGGGRTPRQLLQALGHALPVGRRAAAAAAPVEDTPRWHLVTAEEAMDGGRWEVARAALSRARESLDPSDADFEEASLVSLRLSVYTVDLRSATAEVIALVDRKDPADLVWNRRVRAIVGAAPRVFAGSMRSGLVDLLPDLPGEGEAARVEEWVVPAVAVPVGGLPRLPEPDEWDNDDEEPLAATAAVSSADEEEGVTGEAESPGSGEADVVPVAVDAGEPECLAQPAAASGHASGEAPRPDEAGFDGRVRVSAARIDLEDPVALREHLVEEMLARVSDEEAGLLVSAATTFLHNGDHATAEVMFSAAMQSPEFRIGACEGLVQALTLGGRHREAVANAERAERIFAREGVRLLGIVYWHGVAAQAVGDVATARGCFARIRDSGHADAFADVEARLHELG